MTRRHHLWFINAREESLIKCTDMYASDPEAVSMNCAETLELNLYLMHV